MKIDTEMAKKMHRHEVHETREQLYNISHQHAIQGKTKKKKKYKHKDHKTQSGLPDSDLQHSNQGKEMRKKKKRKHESLQPQDHPSDISHQLLSQAKKKKKKKKHKQEGLETHDKLPDNEQQCPMQEEKANKKNKKHKLDLIENQVLVNDSYILNVPPKKKKKQVHVDGELEDVECLNDVIQHDINKRSIQKENAHSPLVNEKSEKKKKKKHKKHKHDISQSVGMSFSKSSIQSEQIHEPVGKKKICEQPTEGSEQSVVHDEKGETPKKKKRKENKKSEGEQNVPEIINTSVPAQIDLGSFDKSYKKKKKKKDKKFDDSECLNMLNTSSQKKKPEEASSKTNPSVKSKKKKKKRDETNHKASERAEMTSSSLNVTSSSNSNNLSNRSRSYSCGTSTQGVGNVIKSTDRRSIEDIVSLARKRDHKIKIEYSNTYTDLQLSDIDAGEVDVCPLVKIELPESPGISLHCLEDTLTSLPEHISEIESVENGEMSYLSLRRMPVETAGQDNIQMDDAIYASINRLDVESHIQNARPSSLGSEAAIAPRRAPLSEERVMTDSDDSEPDAPYSDDDFASDIMDNNDNVQDIENIIECLPTNAKQHSWLLKYEVHRPRIGAYKTGRWTLEETKQLKRNWKQFFRRYPYDEPYKILRPQNDPQAKEFAKDHTFWLHLSKGIDRTLVAIRLRARRLFYGKTGPFSADEDRWLIRLYDKHGDNWQRIGEELGRYPEICNRRHGSISNLKKGPLSEEDRVKLKRVVTEYKKTHGESAPISWKEIARLEFPGREPTSLGQYWAVTLRGGKENVKYMTGEAKKKMITMMKNQLEVGSIRWPTISAALNNDFSVAYLKKTWNNIKKRIPGYVLKSLTELVDDATRLHFKDKIHVRLQESQNVETA